MLGPSLTARSTSSINFKKQLIPVLLVTFVVVVLTTASYFNLLDTSGISGIEVKKEGIKLNLSTKNYEVPTVVKETAVIPLVKLLAGGRILDPELFKNGPLGSEGHPPQDVSPFLAAYKNPCFFRPLNYSGAPGANVNSTKAEDTKLYCLPYLYVSGSFHAGSKAFAEMLSKHPDVAEDTSSESQFWAEDGKTMQGFLEGFASAATKVASAPDRKIIMEHSASTYPFYWASNIKAHRAFQRNISQCYGMCEKLRLTLPAGPEQQRNLTECMEITCYPRARKADKAAVVAAGLDPLLEAHVPALLAATYWDRPPKMIVLARDPLKRLYSAYMGYFHYSHKYGKSPQGFTAYVREQIGALKNCTAKHGALTCALQYETLGTTEEAVFFHADQIMRGMYSLFLEIWQQYVPPKNWLVIKSEDFFERPAETLKQAINFLGLSPVSDEALQGMIKAAKRRSNVAGSPPPEPEAAKIVRDFYAPYNLRLAELTGDPRYGTEWNARAPE